MSDFISTENPDFTLRIATINDAQLVIDFMKKLGKYQKMQDAIIATPEQIKKLLEEKFGEAIFGFYKEKVVSFAYFYQKSSAFTGRKGLYIDGFFIDDSLRGKGFGKIMFQYISKYAVNKSCEFLEWGCLDWNISAIKFYEKLGAYCVDNMRIYRLTPETLNLNAKSFA
ncbi:MAG: GNAT family N-acetyltransferase [Arcobacter sp.]|jgi:GNAT superfamily N-acetyltransferase|uniref:GNAT family N-acetyltransferase n=1 Tax=Arcobacter sp. TaxID=1872629 RepID=UPI002A74FBEE|nr:GNAT family N-acetyltransferase [Arcobacter sp.]MDY3200462.1 GNAT family N-acetyltransferase [Arcobacter sp.]